MLNHLFKGGITLNFATQIMTRLGGEGEGARVIISAIVGMDVDGIEAEARGIEATEESNYPLFSS